MSTIARIHGREVLDSRGRPTVEVEVTCKDGSHARAIVPSGASTGAAEACELRDGEADRYDGLGVRKAVTHVEKILQPALLGESVLDQFHVDAQLLELDDSPQKTRLGANALLGVSLAVARAAAASLQTPLFRHLNLLWRRSLADTDLDTEIDPKMPLPMTNMISGGLHAGAKLDFQDFLISPCGAPDYATALEWIVRVYWRLGRLLNERGFEGTLVGDEGGYGPNLESNRQAAQFVVDAIRAAGLEPGRDVTLALDVASTHFYRDGSYHLAATGAEELSSSQMIDRLAALVEEFPIVSIEDGLAEDDWQGWQALTARLGEGVKLVGDDLLATNAQRVKQAVQLAAANSALIKVNQIGTLTETFQTMQLARAAGWTCVVSARSGETEDDTIADLAVATAAEQIKIGSVARSERLAKYNRLLRIEEELGPAARGW